MFEQHSGSPKPAEVVAPATPRVSPHPSSIPDEDTIRDLVCGMLSQDPSQLRATVARYYAPSVMLYHYSSQATSALDVYRMYRTYNFAFRSRPIIRDIIIDAQLRNPVRGSAGKHPDRHPHGHVASATTANATGGVAGPGCREVGPQQPPSPQPPLGSCTSVVIRVDQHVVPKRWPLPIPSLIVPTMVLLKFRPCEETGRPLVYEQYNYIGLYNFIWSLSVPSKWLFKNFMVPVVIYGMGAVAYGLDFLEETWRFIQRQVLSAPSSDDDRSGSGCRASVCSTPQHAKDGGGGGGDILNRHPGVRTPPMELLRKIKRAATGTDE